MTMILRIKFTGAPNMKELMEYVKKNLKCRIHDEETDLNENSAVPRPRAIKCT